MRTSKEEYTVEMLFGDDTLTSSPKKIGELDGFSCVDEIANSIRHILDVVGEDAAREGLINTPNRVGRMYLDLTSGYKADLDEILNGALFDGDYDEMVIVQDIDFYSLCEHHLIPFHGFAHVGYIPKEGGRVIGLSKIPRLVEVYAKRLQLQERMTCQIAQVLDDLLHPLGVAVVVEAHHLCCGMRGVKKPNVRMITSSMIGCFKEELDCRSEFLSLIGK